MQKSQTRGILLVLAGLIALVTVPVSQARHQATVVLTNNQRAQGIVRYLPASRSYEIALPQGVTREVRADEVAQIILAQPPPQLQEALQAVQGQRYQQAIPILSRIVEEYAMFGPDIQAGRALMLAYLRTNRSSEALRAAEAMVRRNPNLEREAEFASVYWEVLLAEGRGAALRTALAEAIASGNRDLAAFGLIRRGDIEMQEGRAREALVDGYLRVVLLFRDIASAQPEALFKAIQAHEKLNEVAYAERWRQQLLTRHGTSEFAQRLR